MMITGSTMGVTEAIQKEHDYKNADKKILDLMEDLQEFEEKNIKKLKKFL